MKKSSTKTVKPFSILVLDDNEQWRKILKTTVESDLGVSPFVAGSGHEALGILNANSIDLVVSDLNMPEMNGIQFLTQAVSLSPKTKVIIVSVDVSMSEELIARGAFAVVSKLEITPNLVDVIRTIQTFKEYCSEPCSVD